MAQAQATEQKSVKFNAEGSLITGRSLKEYEALLGISTAAFEGKTVLDIGSGQGTFAKEAAALGVRVIEMDPIYAIAQKTNLLPAYSAEELTRRALPKEPGFIKRHILRNKPTGTEKTGGINETLPFKGGSFDVVVSCISSIAYLSYNYPEIGDREIAARKMIGEIARVLKAGGEARMSVSVRVEPHATDDKRMLDNALHEISRNYDSITSEFHSAFDKCGGSEVLIIRKRA